MPEDAAAEPEDEPSEAAMPVSDVMVSLRHIFNFPLAPFVGGIGAHLSHRKYDKKLVRALSGVVLEVLFVN